MFKDLGDIEGAGGPKMALKDLLGALSRWQIPCEWWWTLCDCRVRSKKSHPQRPYNWLRRSWFGSDKKATSGVRPPRLDLEELLRGFDALGLGTREQQRSTRHQGSRAGHPTGQGGA